MYDRGTSLRVDITPPANNGGEVINKFRVEWSTESFESCTDLSSSNQYRCDVQVIRPNQSILANSSSELSGYFRLELDTTACGACYERSRGLSARLDPDATATEVELALEALSNSGDVDVSRHMLRPPSSSGGVGLYEWRITFRTLVGDLMNGTAYPLIGGVPLL